MLPLRPELYDVGRSPASSSSVYPFVSGTKKETKSPENMKSANICISLSIQGEQALPEQSGSAPFLKRGIEMTWATMAPTLPMAAEIPWPVDR